MPKYVYLVMNQCDDTYYPGHVSYLNGGFHAFDSREAAEAYIANNTSDTSDTSDDEDGPWFYVLEATLHSANT
jgi:hypothetical protein